MGAPSLEEVSRVGVKALARVDVEVADGVRGDVLETGVFLELRRNTRERGPG